MASRSWAQRRRRIIEDECDVEGSASEDEVEDEHASVATESIAESDTEIDEVDSQPTEKEDRIQLDMEEDVEVERSSELVTPSQLMTQPSPVAVARPESVRDASKRGFRFAMTLNNPSPEEEESFKLLPGVRYICYGLEGLGEGRTKHMQAYVEFESKKRYTIRSVTNVISRHQRFPSRWHIESAVASAKVNRDYCMKEGHFWEEGDVPSGQGTRSDLQGAIDMVKEGATIYELAAKLPHVMVTHHRGVLFLKHTLQNVPRDFPTLGYWLHGAAGTGKTRWAMSLSPHSVYMKDPTSKWFCGYSQEDTCIIDDYRPNAELSFSFLLRLADRYPLIIQQKCMPGGHHFCSKRLVITSPVPMEKAFEHLNFLTEGELKQLRRRFIELEFGPGKITHHTRLQDLPPHPLLSE